MMEKTKYIPEYGRSNLITSQPFLICLGNIIIYIKFFIY